MLSCLPRVSRRMCRDGWMSVVTDFGLISRLKTLLMQHSRNDEGIGAGMKEVAKIIDRQGSKVTANAAE